MKNGFKDIGKEFLRQSVDKFRKIGMQDRMKIIEICIENEVQLVLRWQVA